MKKHNPLTLNIVTDEPSYETPLCKWWLCDISEHKRYGLFFTLNKKTDDVNYVIVDIANNQIIHHSKSLEQADMHMAMCDKTDEFD